MSSSLEIHVYDKHRVAFQEVLRQTVELGRQNVGEPAPFVSICDRNGDSTSSPAYPRLIIAPLAEASVSRKHALITPQASGMVQVTNLSQRLPIRFGDDSELAYGQSRTISPPVLLGLGSVQVRIVRPKLPGDDRVGLQSLHDRSIAPGSLFERAEPRSALAPATLREGDLAALVPLLKIAVEVLQSSAHSDEFFIRAAEAAARIIHFDSARVLIPRDGKWTTKACSPRESDSRIEEWQPSARILDDVCTEKRVYWRLPETDMKGELASLLGVGSVIAAPILDRGERVIAILYGERRSSSQRPIEIADAHLMNLLAHAIAVGLARQEDESARSLLEQFLSPNLARQFNLKDLEQGRQADVAVLVCDIRGFSGVSEKHGPERTVAWIRDVMSEMSECVVEQDGVLVDYIGDELMAMWGAPQEQPDHVQRAVRAAQAMIRRLRRIDGRWQAEIGRATQIGIGLNAGSAFVGNVGSTRKFKYGPLGNVVNLASRVQGATKYLKVPVLLTGGVHDRLDEAEFPRRRLCDVRVSGIERPVRLYELATEVSGKWRQLKQDYESALKRYEEGELHGAASTLGHILERQPDDGPALVLLNRSVGLMVSESTDYDPVWPLPGK